MGRPFANELAGLPENLAFAFEHPVESLRKALERARVGRVLACGAGGSYSAAAFSQLLFQEAGADAQPVTPLHFLQSRRPTEPTTLLLFTAGGRNKDVLRVIDHARELEVSVVLVCANPDSPAARLARKAPGNTIFDFAYPARRDGFLAVNSLAVTWWLAARAFGHTLPNAREVADALGREYQVEYISPDRRHACLLLHDRWTKAVAVDLESKMSEAALCAPLIADWRQFGHGRHHWLAKNAEFSSVVSVETPESGILPARSLGLLPKKVPQCRLTTKAPGIAGVCSLLLRSFVLVGQIGRQVGIDPGRPGVPPFGSALYHLAAVPAARARKRTGWDLELATARKLDEIGLRGEQAEVRDAVAAAGRRYAKRMAAARFGAVVLDFDGTAAAPGILPENPLCEEIAPALLRLLKRDIVVGIATGRGDSCHQNLAASLPKALWPRVLVCHYNGASIGTLADLMRQPISWPKDPVLLEIESELAADPVLAALAEIKNKGPQLTLRTATREKAAMVERIVRSRIAKAHRGAARIVASSHTLDVVPLAATKVALIDHIQKHYTAGGPVLAIGDRGDIGGNDFELLATRHSLSVDRVSPDLESCWNFLPQAVSHHHGTAVYLEHSRLSPGTLHLNPP